MDGLQPVANRLRGAKRKAFQVRAAMMRRALRVKLAILILLYLGVIAAALAWLAPYVTGLRAIADWAAALAQTLSGLSLLLLGLLLLVQRRVAQLEADLVVLCIRTQ